MNALLCRRAGVAAPRQYSIRRRGLDSTTRATNVHRCSSARCTAGRRACPPEDCGGLWGYYELLNTLANRRNLQHRTMLDWLGIESADEFDPGHFSAAEVNAELSQISKVLVKR